MKLTSEMIRKNTLDALLEGLNKKAPVNPDFDIINTSGKNVIKFIKFIKYL